MNRFTVSYTYKYTLDFASEYAFTKNMCYNIKSGRIIKKVINNACIGYNIRGKFYSLTYLRNHLIKTIKTDCPF